MSLHVNLQAYTCTKTHFIFTISLKQTVATIYTHICTPALHKQLLLCSTNYEFARCAFTIFSQCPLSKDIFPLQPTSSFFPPPAQIVLTLRLWRSQEMHFPSARHNSKRIARLLALVFISLSVYIAKKNSMSFFCY